MFAQPTIKHCYSLSVTTNITCLPDNIIGCSISTVVHNVVASSSNTADKN